MRLIIPLILIALMLPYATGEDQPTDEWLIPPDPAMGVSVAAGAGSSDAGASRRATTQPTTRPAATASCARRSQR
jgi:hypothetical protein